MSDSISTPLRSNAAVIDTFSLEDDDSFEVETPDFHFPWLAKREGEGEGDGRETDESTAKARAESPAVAEDPLRWSRVSSLKQGNLSSTPSSASSSHVLGPSGSTTSWSSASPDAPDAPDSRPPLPLSSSVHIGEYDRSRPPPLSARSYNRVVSAPVPGSALRGQSTLKALDDMTAGDSRARSSYVTPGLSQRTMATSAVSSARRAAKPNANLSRFGGPARRVIPQEEEEEEEEDEARVSPVHYSLPSLASTDSPGESALPSVMRTSGDTPSRLRPVSPPREHKPASPPIVPLETSERENRPREPARQYGKVDGQQDHAPQPRRDGNPQALQASRPAPPVHPPDAHWAKPADDTRPKPAPVTAGPKKLFVVNGVPYERLGVLGKGGTSKVYSVLCPTKRVVYALKRVSLERADAETYQSYTNEIELLRRLRGHDRIIQLIDHQITFTPGNRPKLLMMVMECGEIDFANLLDEQRDKPLNWNFIGLYWQQMLEAVQAVHAQNVVHTDLKPANFVLVKGRLKIIDFGIAKAIANDTVNIQRDQQIGTVNYMSPEAIQKMNNQKVLKLSFPSDVWSLGCILYQMVYGSPPFHHIPGGPLIKMNKIADPNFQIDYPSTSTSRPHSDAESVTAGVPPEAIRAMRSCLEYNKDRRLTIPQLLLQDFLSPLRKPSADATPITRDQIAMLVNFVLGENGLKPLGAGDHTAEDLFQQLWTQNELSGR